MVVVIMKKILKISIGLTFMISLIISSVLNVSAISKKSQKKINQEENIVFLGDSIFDWYPTEKIYDDFPVVNSGIAGNKTTDILKNMEERVYKYNPTKVFLLIGTNDIEWEDSDELNEEVYNNIKKIAQKIRKNRKNAKIYVLSILPVNNNMSGAHDRHISEIKTINKKLENFCKNEKYITYVDAFDGLTNSDEMFYEGYTKDGLHPNDLGYAKITEMLMKYMYE